MLKKYSLELENIHIAKQKLTQEIAQDYIDHCFEKFREDIRNYRFVVLPKKNFMPRIEEGERESDSEDEPSSKWRDRVRASIFPRFVIWYRLSETFAE